MRLCHVANPNSIHTRRYLHDLVDRGYEVHLIGTVPAEHPIPSAVIFHDLTARVNVRKLRFVVWGGIVRRLVRQIRPDVLHAHQVAGAGWVAASAGYHPLLVSAWGSDLLLGPKRSWIHRQLAGWVLHRADYVTGVSKTLTQAAHRLGVDPARLQVVPFGVDTGVFHPPSGAGEVHALRAQFGLPRGPVVLSLRALHPVYNPLDVAYAIPRVLERAPDTTFAIRSYSYTPHLLARFQEIVSQSGAAQAVHYIGSQPDDRAIADLCRAADVAVSVPSSDGTPVSVLEAMACGAVPVLSDLESLREWVQNGREGLLVPVGDVKAIADAITRLVTDEGLCGELRTNALALIRERGDSRIWLSRMEEIYRQLCTSAS